jgi:hypothetical protein
MALTPRQVASIRAKGDYLRKVARISEYTYDLKYSSKYTESEVAKILATGIPPLSLTEQDVRTLSENHVFSIAKTTLVELGTRLFKDTEPTNNEAAKFATLVLLWGCASQGYGGYRIREILSGGTVALGRNTLVSLQALRSGDVASAYTCWLGRNHINGLGESFFTKIIYFLAKVISPLNPIALIKDNITSHNSATFFEIDSLTSRGLESYLDYMEAIDVGARVAKITMEKIEEMLFSLAPCGLEVNLTSSKIVERGFSFAQDFQCDFKPPVLSDEEYLEPALDDYGLYRIMLVADGKPQCKGLPEMAFSPELRPVTNGFFSTRREGVVREANARANDCRRGTPTYVMTTGFGAVSVTATINLYNVPGEEAIRLDNYWQQYRQSISNILPRRENISKVLIVYYAGVSKRAFRDGIFRILQELSDDPTLEANYEIDACMYGARQHLSDKWSKLCVIFDSLGRGDAHRLQEIQHDWVNNHMNVSPFFVWF